ncbi:hypothetical protein QBC47DRAFT_393214 [Echria macrotheca]|uniref:DUF7137 domain-containing protein n=1 Tax=Echria macrotheca TaxID=438768 RepID=A0AAJ0F103_9PEZI|nr:hypothetical protein QBC47DRAFT_393214 [Echria macrotheca]
MRVTRSMGQLAVAVLSLSPAVSAFASWPKFLPALNTLVVRQDSTPSPSPSPTGSSTSASASGPQQTNYNTGGRTATGTGATGNSTKTGGSAKHTLFNPQDPAGNVVMLTPAITDGTQLYKIKDYVTWGWNYTNLQATPTAVDVKISCSAARQTWTLTQNMTFATNGAYTWDTEAFQSANVASPLPVEQYTLLIHDSDGAVTSTPEAGYLAPFSGFIFGLYSPRAPTPLDDFVCATCSGAMSDMERRVLGGAVAMSIITVLSFTWFVAGFGAFV